MATEKKLTAKQINEAAERSIKKKASKQKIIITKRAVIKAPTGPIEDTSAEPQAVSVAISRPSLDMVPTASKKIMPLESSLKPDALPDEALENQPTTKPVSESTDTDVVEPKEDPKNEDAEIDTSQQVNDLIASGSYFLPINTLEKKRAKRAAVLGVIVIIILAGAWFNIALDAGLIKVGGVKSVTHFFSQ